jgi:hypothetical protein
MRWNLRPIDEAIERPRLVLPTPGGAHEAENRPLDVGFHLADGQVLEDALLDLLEVVVVVVEDLLGLDEIDLGLRPLRPGQSHEPVEVGARHGVFGGGGRHLAQAVQLAQGLLLRLVGHARGFDLVAELVVFALLVVAFAQLLLDGLHLLAQVVLALVLLQLGLDLALDLVADLEHLEVFHQDLVEPIEPRADLEDLQHLLLLRGGQRRQAARDEVGEARGILDVRGQGLQLVGERGGELHHALEEALRALGEGLHLDLVLGTDDVVQQLDVGADVRTILVDLLETEALHALHHEAQRPVGELEHLVDVRERADPEEIALDRIVDRGVALRDHADHLPLAHRLVHERDRRLPCHRERKDGVREQDRVAEGQYGQLRRHTRLRLRDPSVFVAQVSVVVAVTHVSPLARR